MLRNSKDPKAADHIDLKQKMIVTVSAYVNVHQCLTTKNAGSIVGEFMLQNIKISKADECNNGMDKTTIVIEPVHFNYYFQSKMRTEEDSIAGYHLLRNIKISDAAELDDGLEKKVEKDQVE